MSVGQTQGGKPLPSRSCQSKRSDPTAQ